MGGDRLTSPPQVLSRPASRDLPNNAELLRIFVLAVPIKEEPLGTFRPRPPLCWGARSPYKEEPLGSPCLALPFKEELLPNEDDLLPNKDDLLPNKDDLLPNKDDLLPNKEDLLPIFVLPLPLEAAPPSHLAAPSLPRSWAGRDFSSPEIVPTRLGKKTASQPP